MQKLSLYFILATCFVSVSCFLPKPDELDRVFVYRNSKLVGAWRADEGQIVHVDNVANGDTLIFKARTDLGGLGNSSIDIKDDTGVPVDNIQSPGSSSEAADFIYVVNLKKIDTGKVMSLQVFLNVDPARNLPPPTVASISFIKK